MTATEILKTRVTPEMKARVGEITQAELLTEAVWLRRIVAEELRENQTASVPDESIPRNAGSVLARRGLCSKNLGPASRLYVRIRREDHLLLHERAAARGMASATYVSVLQGRQSTMFVRPCCIRSGRRTKIAKLFTRVLLKHALR
ncbi:MAG: hypothetical protein ACRD19_13610 [Terriglobia bacterium]